MTRHEKPNELLPDRGNEKLSLVQLLPNMLTITAICAGLTAIRLASQGNYVLAVQLIILAAIMDGIDGRIARATGSDSKMGAELDSLADFLNFGVAPALILHFWTLHDLKGLGWMAVLIYAVCCVVRLARFNVSRKETEAASDHGEDAYFVGIPAPAGAMLAMMPMFVSFAFSDGPVLPYLVMAGYMVLIGLLMISRIPTWSFKTTRIPRVNVKYFLVGFVVVGAAVVMFPWTSLVLLGLVYIGAVVWKLVTR